jgi:hypothetical protein
MSLIESVVIGMGIASVVWLLLPSTATWIRTAIENFKRGGRP